MRGIKMKRLTAYVDGSYNKDSKVYGYGMVIITDTENHCYKGNGIDTEGVWNVAGEVKGAEKAINYALENGYDELTICHDYKGIQKWADGEWKAKKKISSDYVNCVNNARLSGLQIHFRWVKGHSGDPYNEQADCLAKEAINNKGIILGESGKGVKFCVKDEIISQNIKSSMVEDAIKEKEQLEKMYGKSYRDYSADIVNQIMTYAEETHKASSVNFTTKVLVEALHQLTGGDTIKF